MTQKFKVLVTRKWPKKVEENFSQTFEATLNENDVPLSEKDLHDAMQNFDALLPTVTDSISDKIISTENKKVKIIGNFGVGFNNIDIESAKNNIVVTNTPEVLTDCTADIAMLLMLGVARRGSEGEFHVRKRMDRLETNTYDGNKSYWKNFRANRYGQNCSSYGTQISFWI